MSILNRKTIIWLLLISSILIALLLFSFHYLRYEVLHKVDIKHAMVFEDDMDLLSLKNVLTKQIAYLEKLPQESSFTSGDFTFSRTKLLESAKSFHNFLEKDPEPIAITRFLRDNFELYQAGGRKKKLFRQMLVTGYYEPLFKGSLTKVPPFLTPIYSLPDSLVSKTSQGNPPKKLIGRYNKNNKFVPFWSRAEIELGGHLKGHELAYLKDPFDAFLLHVQGSGRIQFPDGTIKSVRFGGTNNLEYKSIGKLLVDQKKMALKDVSVPAIRSYLLAHPSQTQSILHHNPRYIFFTWGDHRGAIGSSGQLLTPGRSIAIDSKVLVPGTIGYLISRKPLIDQTGSIVEWTQLKRFVFPQDSGAAIKGSGRVDMFWGSGLYAESAANHMKEKGKLYFLIKKN